MPQPGIPLENLGFQTIGLYGGASLASARWAGEHGMNFLTSSVVRAEEAEESEDFAEVQVSHIRAFRTAHPGGAAARVSQGLVVIPTDSATAAQRTKYAAYVAARTPRTTSPVGPARMMFARDLLGASDVAGAGHRSLRCPAPAPPSGLARLARPREGSVVSHHRMPAKAADFLTLRG
jgi:alkanesulfonate monooxygenase SsuD/methylene tetrahydromethanopterin reductase-like flavin-dependent oxidoreductase (luciferase family)